MISVKREKGGGGGGGGETGRERGGKGEDGDREREKRGGERERGGLGWDLGCDRRRAMEVDREKEGGWSGIRESWPS